MKMASSASSSSVLLLLFALFAAAAIASPNSNGYMHLRFYNHERILGSGPYATVVYAVERTSSSSGAGFGNIIVYDNLLRTGVQPDSPIIGRNQGMGVGSSLAENSGLTNFQLVFTAGEYNGSSLALQGLFPVAPLGTVFERAITGGTGKFRLARGYLLTTEVHSTNTTLTGQLDAYITFR
ncbi:dirigent protein 22-like [Curcuma longa]|uniref:dirigent protein 22-like n=1 Tax=Curcuma longa TaxID=136217 RepID=UPI003D9E1458